MNWFHTNRVTKIKEKHLNFKFEDLHFCFTRYNKHTILPCLSEQLLTASSVVRGEVDMYSVVFCRDGLLYKRLVEDVALYFNCVICFNQCITWGSWRREKRRGRGKNSWRKVTLLPYTWHVVYITPRHHMTPHHIMWHYIMWHMTSHDTTVTYHDIASCDITWHQVTSYTTSYNITTPLDIT